MARNPVAIVVIGVVSAALLFVVVASWISGDKIYTWYLYRRYPLAYKEDIIRFSSEYRLSSPFVAAVIYEESRFNPQARSDKGALGLMQILPETGQYIARHIGEEKPSIEVLMQPPINIRYGAYYLSYLVTKYGDIEKVLAAYNAGEGNVDGWLKQDPYEIPFKETRNFVQRVIKSQRIYESLYSFSD